MHTAPRGLVDLNMRPAHDHKVAMRNGILEVQFRCLQQGGHWGHSMRCNLGGSQLVSQPASGCAPRIQQVATDKVEQVVFEVMRELERRGVL